VVSFFDVTNKLDICPTELSQSDQKVQKSNFQSQFPMSKKVQIFLKKIQIFFKKIIKEQGVYREETR
jgi:hypothetical protein